MVKHPPVKQKTQVQSLGGENLLEKETATHSGILAWRISWTEETGGLQSLGSQRVGHDWATNTHFNLIYKLERIYSFIPQVFKHFLSAKHYSRNSGSIPANIYYRIILFVLFRFGFFKYFIPTSLENIYLVYYWISLAYSWQISDVS